MKPKFKIKKRKPGNSVKLISFGSIAFLVLIVGLGFLVRWQNDEQCQQFGLKGGFFSCTIDNKYEYASIAFVAGNTSNSPVPILTKTTKKYIQNSVGIEDSVVNVFSATPSHPRISYKEEKNSTDESDDIENLKNIANARIEAVEQAIQTTPMENGADYLGAIIRAGRFAKSKAADYDNGKAIVIVIGSGLSDSGILNFSDEKAKLVDLEENKIVQQLKDNDIITERQLSGVTIYWSGLGETVSPQSEVNDVTREKLEKIYMEILEEAGANVRGFDPIESGETTSVQSPYTVKTAYLGNTPCVWNCPIDEYSALFFEGNSDQFGKGSNPWGVVNEIVNDMREDSSIKARIVGYVAKLTCNDTVPDNDLALRRANAVKRLIIEAGIDESRIVTESGGFGEENECERSSYPDESVRKRNRKIVIFKQ